MKHKILFFLLLFLSIPACLWAQRVSLDFKHVKLEKIFKEISKQTGKTFTYSQPVVNVNEKVSIKVDNQKLEHVLNLLFKDLPISYEIDKKKIYLNAKKKERVDGKSKKADIKIKGVVLDESGETVIGAALKVKGYSNIGTITDVDGRFKMHVPTNSVLEVSYMGYSTKEVPVKESDLKIVLKEDNQLLDEVVVVGYGTQKRRQLTSSVATLKKEEFNPGAVTSAYGLIKGKVPGLHISKGSHGGSTVLLRGVTSVNGKQSPLIVIDGVPGASTANLDPEDIESVDVLKDGSAAAIYGTRGTNGVILITTKQSDKEVSKITYNSYLSVGIIAKQPKVLNREQYLQVNPEAAVDYGYDTDWMKETFNNDIPITHHHNVSLSGGGMKTNYRVALNYDKSEQIVKDHDRYSYGARVNINHKAFNNRLSIMCNLYTRVSNSKPLEVKELEKTISMNPTAPIMDPDNPLKYFEPGTDEYNPIAAVDLMRVQNKTVRLGGDLRLNLDIYKGLKMNLLYAMKPKYELSKEYDAIESYASQRKDWNGRAKQKSKNSFEQLLDFSLSYYLDKNNHSVDIVGGYSYNDIDSERFEAENYGFLSDGFKWNNLSQGDWLGKGKAYMDSNRTMSKLIALFGRVNYSFADTYLISASFRHEGSSKFAKKNKWGFFPAVSGGLRISNLSFMRGQKWLKDLKLRVGYGVTGNEGFDEYMSQPTIAAIKDGYFFDPVLGTWILTYGPAKNANPYLKWEKKHEWNVGLDFSILNSRISGTIDFYVRNTKDLLYDNVAATPPMLYPEIFSNIGQMTNKGFELGLNIVPIKQKKFRWDISSSFSIFKNKLNGLFNEITPMTYLDLESLSGMGYAYRIEEGRPVSQYYGYKHAGFTDEGRWLLYNKEGEKVVREDLVESDKQYLGNGLPRMSIGLHNTFSYKNWSLSFFLRGDFLFKILNEKEIHYGNKISYPRNLLKSALTKHAQINDAKVYSDYYLESGNYVKLDNVMLSYRFKPKRGYVKDLKLYVTGEGLFCISNYSGVDPELSGRALSWGIDKNRFYPRMRTYTFGFNMTL